jgi:hypothetical protein
MAKTPGQIAYEAFTESAPQSQGEHFVPWETLPEWWQKPWEKAAEALKTETVTVESYDGDSEVYRVFELAATIRGDDIKIHDHELIPSLQLALKSRYPNSNFKIK